MLEHAAELLPPTDPDAFYVQNHREALQQGLACDCNNGDRALASLVQRLVEPRLPDGLLKGVTVQLRGDGPPDIGVELNRKPTEGESEQLHRVLSQALAELREEHRKAGYSR